MTAARRIGILGGTFDPVHLGHLIVAEQCRDAARLDEVWFVPSARPPHKTDAALTPFDRRVEMLTLACAGHPNFRIEPLEKDRPGPSFTADTLDELHRRHPDDTLLLIVGADCLPDLAGWYDPLRIVTLAELLVTARPGYPLLGAAELAEALRLSDPTPLRLTVVPCPQIEIASRQIRQRVAQQRSIRYLVPRAVEVYIDEKRLYRDATPTSA